MDSIASKGMSICTFAKPGSSAFIAPPTDSHIIRLHMRSYVWWANGSRSTILFFPLGISCSLQTDWQLLPSGSCSACLIIIISFLRPIFGHSSAPKAARLQDVFAIRRLRLWYTETYSVSRFLSACILSVARRTCVYLQDWCHKSMKPRLLLWAMKFLLAYVLAANRTMSVSPFP